jgi:hypothetical protein
MTDHLGAITGGQRHQRRIGHVHAAHIRRLGDVVARGHVVDADDLVAIGREAIDEMRSDEAGRAGDEYAHAK